MEGCLSGMLAPPREKQALPRPAPQKLTKPAGRKGAKLTVDCTDYAHTFGEINEMKEKLFIWSFVQLVIIWFAERPFKSQRM